MDFVYQAKVVGLSFHKVKNAVENGDCVLLVADTENEFDTDAIKVINSDGEVIGFIANSDRTLSTNNRANGNLSASELKEKLVFENRKYVANVIKSFHSCIYLEINSENWSNLHPKPQFDDVSDVAALKTQVSELKAIIGNLQSQIIELTTIVNGLKNADVSVEVNPSPKPSSERIMYSFVGLSHFDGQNHLDGKLSIKEEPIFEGAKGTAVYLKVDEYRIGVSPSAKKKQYCEDHKIPYMANKNLKGKSFGGDIRIEELVFDEYAVVSM